MKKLVSLIVVFVFLLCGCSRNTKVVSGWVDSYIWTDNSQYPVVVIKTDNDKKFGIVFDQHTFMHGWIDEEVVGLQTEKLKNGTAEDVELQVHYRGGFRNIKNGTENVKSVDAEIIIISAVLKRQGYTMENGTLLDVVDDGNRITYQLADGTQLLRVNDPTGPENVYSGNIYGFDVLSEEAKAKVLEYYNNRGLLYNETEVLEQAYRHYGYNPSDFHTYYLEQNISPAAGNKNILSFITVVTLPLGNGYTGQEIRLGEIFDIHTGEYISGYDLFNCESEKAVDILIEAAFDNAAYYSESTNDDAKLKEQMKQNMKPEYIILWKDNLEIAFPAGTLEGVEHCFIMGFDYTEEIKAIMHDWAIPDTEW